MPAFHHVKSTNRLDLIRNKPVDMAMAILKHTPKAACEDLQKIIEVCNG